MGRRQLGERPRTAARRHRAMKSTQGLALIGALSDKRQSDRTDDCDWYEECRSVQRCGRIHFEPCVHHEKDCQNPVQEDGYGKTNGVVSAKS